MQEHAERIVTVGFSRRAREVVDEIEQISAAMIRQGWSLADSCLEESLGNIHLFFVREIDVPQ
jgi:hypothetical protein